MNEDSDNLIRVNFTIDSTQWHGSSSETLWAICIEEGLRKLDNIPFLTFGVSLGDTIRNSINFDGLEEFATVIIKGGHSTYRLFIDGEVIPKDRLQDLANMGCLYEVGKFGQVVIVSISVPPECDIREIYNKLEAGESDGVWDFEEANFEHPT